MSNLKVEGKVGDFCPNCKNCKAVTRMHDGKNASIRIIEVDCEDPYDGMVKTLDVDSDICCSMFEPKKEKESFNLNMPSRIISEEEYNNLKKSHDSWRERYYEIRYALRKDEQLDESISCVRDIPSDVEMIEDLKKRAADSDYYKEKSELLEERNDKQFNTIREKNNDIDRLRSLNKELEVKLKNANEVADSWKRDYERIREQFLCPLYDILYPDNPNLNINVTDLLNYVKDLKVYADENESMYADLKYWKERCHGAETDVTTLNSKVETLKNKKDKYLKKMLDQQATHYKQCVRILDLENMVSKLQSGEYDDILAKDIEIKSLQDKYESAMTGWKDAIDTNDKSQSEIDNLTESNENLTKVVDELQSDIATLNSKIKVLDKRNTNQSVIIGEKGKQIEELTRRYNMIAKKLNDIHDILKEDPNNA